MEQMLLVGLENLLDQVDQLYVGTKDMDRREILFRMTRSLNEVRSLAAQLAPGDMMRESGKLFASRTRLDAPAESFTYRFDGRQLVRQGTRGDGMGKYEQSVELTVLQKVADRVAQMYLAGETRIAGTMVHRHMPELPHYKVNAAVSFFRDSGLMEELQSDPRNWEPLVLAALQKVRG